MTGALYDVLPEKQEHIDFVLIHCRESDYENSVYSVYRQNLFIYSTNPTFTINTSFWGRLRRMHNFFFLK
jgi:hypothetical protein